MSRAMTSAEEELADLLGPDPAAVTPAKVPPFRNGSTASPAAPQARQEAQAVPRVIPRPAAGSAPVASADAMAATSSEIKPDTGEAIKFLRKWPSASSHLWALHIDPVTHANGEKEGGDPFGRKELAGPTAHWIDQRQGKANLYFTVNSLLRKPANGKAKKTDIDEVVAFQIDIDVLAGEDQATGVERILRAVRSFRLAPNAIILSGGGVQAFWILRPEDRIKIGGDLAKAEAAECYGRGLEDEFNAILLPMGLKADDCHNVDRVMRLPGTLNIPNAKKIAKGRKLALAKLIEFNDLTYLLSDFKPAPPKGSTDKPATFTPSGKYPPIDMDDPRLAKLDSKWKRIAVEGIYDDYGGDRSAAMMAFTTAGVRVGVADEVLASCLMNCEIGAHIREHSNVAYALKRTIERAKEFVQDQDLGEMNSKHCVILDDGGKCCILNEIVDAVSGERKVTYSSFEQIKNRYSNRKKMVKRPDGEKEAPLATWWLHHPQRRQCEQLVFAPGKTAMDAYNLWPGFAVVPDRVESEAKCSLYLAHIRDNISQRDKAVYEYLIKWMASAVQKPGQPGGTALVMRGNMGNGKGEAVRHFGKLFGSNYMPVSKKNHVTGNFNAHLGQTILLFVDEALFAANPEHEQILKNMVTERHQMIERKGFDLVCSPSCLHIIIASNNEWTVAVSQDDRRFCCIEVGDEHKQDIPYFTALATQMENGGYGALLGFLLSVDLTGFHPESFPRTAEHDRQRARTRAGIDAFIEQICHDGRVPYADRAYPHVAITSGEENNRGFDYYINQKADGVLRRMRAQNVKAALRKDWACDKWKEPKGARRSGIEFPPLADLRQMFSAKHGPVDWDASDLEDWESDDCLEYEAPSVSVPSRPSHSVSP